MKPMDRELPSRYLQTLFKPQDTLAVVLVNRTTPSVVQRIATAEKLAALDFQVWLRDQNEQRAEIFVSMNPLRSEAHTRTKRDVAAIRHLYLDIDQDGNETIRRIFARSDLPTPSFIVNTSADKWQVIWQVERFTTDQAEALQKSLARDVGADPAATDCTRVLRWPGFHNYKYNPPYLVRGEAHAASARTVYRPEHFPSYERAQMFPDAPIRGRSSPIGRPSQSEHDWAYAKRALARGDAEETVIMAIASHRRFDKHNPRYYAELTVRKAAQELRSQADPDRISDSTPDR